MNLLIVSHTPHYKHENGIVGWGATVREIDELAGLFASVVHVAPLFQGPPPPSSMPYRSSRVRLSPVNPAGGSGFLAKVGIPFSYPRYARVILAEMSKADVMHVRAPANISLLALILMGFTRHPRNRWAKYAGDWSGGKGEPWSYRLQRYLLRRRVHRGVVTVNGSWPDQPSFVVSFVNPCLTSAEVIEGLAATKSKRLEAPVRLLFVGRLETEKGVASCLRIVAALLREKLDSRLDLIGDGPERPDFEKMASELGIGDRVKFHGGLPRDHLGPFYARTHFFLLPSRCSEGWPKVLSEAMAYGAVPLSTKISSIPQFLAEFGTGKAFDSTEEGPFRDAILGYMKDPQKWSLESGRACEAASRFSYERYLGRVREILGM